MVFLQQITDVAGKKFKSLANGTATGTKILFGDVNLDGETNLLDIQPFVALILAGEFQVEGDVNLDSSVDLLDISPFVALLVGG